MAVVPLRRVLWRLGSAWGLAEAKAAIVFTMRISATDVTGDGLGAFP